MQQTHTDNYINKKVASSLIHHFSANFGKSATPYLKDNQIVLFRVVLIGVALLGLIFQYLGEDGSFTVGIFTDLEYYASLSSVIALFLSSKAQRYKNYGMPSGKEIRTSRHSVIWNALALILNLVTMIIYFLFVPITLASDGKLAPSYYANYKTFAFLLSFLSIFAHFLCIQFILLERDYKWVVVTLSFWSFANLTTETDGLFFNQMTGAKNIVKISLSAFFVLSTTCLYFWLCQGSQWFKGIRERKVKKEILKSFRKDFYEQDEDEEEDSESTDSGSDASEEENTAVFPIARQKTIAAAKSVTPNSDNAGRRERLLTRTLGQSN